MQKENFIKKLIEWYSFQKRELPWRNTKDPYKIWISEIILQQTRIVQGLPYFNKFIEKYPTLQDLADASETEILRLWQGLGYYSRARNMLFCAKTLQSEHGGHFPDSFEELCKLKGIGTYTAAAITSFAFGKKAAVLDGNVFRVLSRVFGIGTDITSSAGKKEFSKLANDLLPDSSSDIYNQAIMEFGALHCNPKNPLCMSCPFQQECYAYNFALPEEFPVKIKKLKRRNRYFSYFAIKGKTGYYMKMRQPGDIWTGLFDLFMVENDEMKSYSEVAEQVREKFNLDFRLHHETSEYKYILTHQTIYAKFFEVEFRTGVVDDFIAANDLKCFTINEIEDLPKPNLISNFFYERFFS